MGTSVNHEGCCIDRLSGLPDSVLSHILSFLPTRQVVRTSVLSTRWKYLYASVTTLDFADGVYESSSGFMDFVDRVLFSHDTTCIKRFHLHLRCVAENKDDSARRICGWVSFALKRCVQELHLECYNLGAHSGILPATLFTSEKLVKLVLNDNSDFVMTIPAKVCFPSLKTLHLINVDYIDDDSFQRLLSGCLVLEELSISAMWQNVIEITISIPSLKTLTIAASFCDYGTHHVYLDFVIDAASIVDIKLVDFVAESCSLLNLQSLVNAHLKNIFCGCGGNDMEAAASNILKGINNVRSLYVTPDVLEYFSLCNKSEPLPVFRNLVLLEIGESTNCWAEIYLAEFLTSSPNLETLIFDTSFVELEGDEDETMPYSVLSDQLKVIEMNSFSADETNLLLVEYFLKNASGLEKLKIQMYSYLPEKEQLEIAKKVLMFPRVSKVCQVEMVCR
ncbi:hypothetical protein PTKIN_Ptkin18bG0143300 [Pterospermum kingtungense]